MLGLGRHGEEDLVDAVTKRPGAGVPAHSCVKVIENGVPPVGFVAWTDHARLACSDVSTPVEGRIVAAEVEEQESRGRAVSHQRLQCTQPIG